MTYVNKFNPATYKDSDKEAQLKKEIFNKVKQLFKIKFFKQTFHAGIDVVETAGKFIGSEELVNGVDAVLDGWWTGGKYAGLFNKELQKFLKVHYSMLVNSGSSANLVAFLSLTSPLLGKRKINKGDEVITVAAAFPTTVNPIIQFGCVPVFVDIDLNTLNINYHELSKALSVKTKAVMIAHTQGNPFNLKEVTAFCRKNNLWLIEDSCDALGATYENRRVGTFGDIASFSFYPAHQLTMGEGGAVVTNNPLLYRIAKSFRDWGRDCWCEPGEDDVCRRRFTWKFEKLPLGYDHKFVYSHIGYNLKLSDMQAAIGLAQIQRLTSFIAKRRQNYSYLKNKLKKYNSYFIFQDAEKKSEPSWFGFMLTLAPKCPFNVHKISIYLNDHKIATRPLYCGNVTKQPYFKNITFRLASDLKNTDYVMENTFWVGVHPNLTKKHMDYMVKTISDFISEKI